MKLNKHYQICLGTDYIKSAIVPMSEELYIISEYIYLQKVRFGERLDYIEMVSDECKSVPVPIFLFQL